jgi:hypothetical protein
MEFNIDVRQLGSALVVFDALTARLWTPQCTSPSAWVSVLNSSSVRLGRFSNGD